MRTLKNILKTALGISLILFALAINLQIWLDNNILAAIVCLVFNMASIGILTVRFVGALKWEITRRRVIKMLKNLGK